MLKQYTEGEALEDVNAAGEQIIRFPGSFQTFGMYLLNDNQSMLNH